MNSLQVLSNGDDASLLDDFMNKDKNKKKLDPYHFYAGETYGQ